jgi:hypothetical protein
MSQEDLCYENDEAFDVEHLKNVIGTLIKLEDAGLISVEEFELYAPESQRKKLSSILPQRVLRRVKFRSE